MPTVSDDGRTYTLPASPRLPLLAALERTGDRGDLPSRDRARAASADQVLRGVLDGRRRRLCGLPRRAGQALRGRHRARRHAHRPSQRPLGDAARPARQHVFCAVPPNTPISAAGVERIPMAGPYYFASYTPKRRLVLRRNPNYGGRRPARSRRSRSISTLPAARAVAAVEAGPADYVNAVPWTRSPRSTAAMGPTASRRGRAGNGTSAVHGPDCTSPPQHPPAAVRRHAHAPGRQRGARPARARAPRARSGRAAPGRPTDQFIPPGFPGFRDAAIYPLGRPGPRRARRLAGGRRRRAVLYTCTAPACREQGRVTRRNLAAIGIDLEVKHFSLSEMFGRLQTPGEPWDVGYGNWSSTTRTRRSSPTCSTRRTPASSAASATAR